MKSRIGLASALAGAALIGAMAGPPLGNAAAREAGAVAKHIDGSTIKKHTLTGNRLENNTVTGKQIEESTLGVVPKAASVSALQWFPLTLENGWTNDSDGRTPAVAVSSEGIVYFRGALDGTAASDDTFATFTTTLRPSAAVKLPIDECDEASGTIEIDPDGSISVTEDAGAVDCTTYSLDGLTYALGS